jgi:hypothetical protein
MWNSTVAIGPEPRTTASKPSDRGAAAIGGVGFDWLMVALGAWLLGGLYLDGWAHIHVPALETFFTPWHAVLYSGYLAGAAALTATFHRNRRRGASWSSALPAGYGLSFGGVFIFLFGGVADMLWHVIFGIENGVEGLISPTHLALALGGSLMVTGPLRAGLHGGVAAAPSWISRMAMVASLTLLLSDHLLHRIRESVRVDVGGADPWSRHPGVGVPVSVGWARRLPDSARGADGAGAVCPAKPAAPPGQSHAPLVGERRADGPHP